MSDTNDAGIETDGAESALDGEISRVSRDPEAPDALGETEIGAADGSQETTNHTPAEGIQHDKEEGN